MKKYMSLLIAFVLLLSYSSSLGEETGFLFTFRNGITWGMPVEEVVEKEANYTFDLLDSKKEYIWSTQSETLETRKQKYIKHQIENYELQRGNFQLEQYNVYPTYASDFTISLFYWFYDKNLVACLYDFMSQPVSKYIVEALSYKYGKFEKVDLELLSKSLKALGAFDDIDEEDIADVYYKRLEDDTDIFAFTLDGECAVLYSNIASSLVINGYNLEGL